jgi:hypothetical protein
MRIEQGGACFFTGQNFVVLRQAIIKVHGNHVSHSGAG